MKMRSGLRRRTSRARGEPTERSRDWAVAHDLAVAGLVGVFAYQGIVPKLWKADRDEVALWEQLGLNPGIAKKMVRVVGVVEATFALTMAVRADDRWPFVVALATMPNVVLAAAKAERSSLTRAFNPGSLGIAVAALAAIGLATRNARETG
jgi:DoxX-like protein